MTPVILSSLVLPVLTIATLRGRGIKGRPFTRLSGQILATGLSHPLLDLLVG